MPDSASDLAKRYQQVRGASEALILPLSPEDCAAQSMPLASPAKWHLAHTTWFFETLVLEGATGYEAFDPRFRFLFNSYYNSIGEQFPQARRGLLTRPALEEVRRYRRHVDESLLQWLRSEPDESGLGVVELGLHHEQQHQELLLTDVKHLLGQNPLRPVYRPAPAPAPAAGAAPATRSEPPSWHRYPAGLRWIGHEGPGFAFDNETPRHRTHLEAFELASRPVTNAEFAAFVADGGYQQPEHWLAEGWLALEREGWRAPLYWEQRDGGWWEFTLCGLRPVEPDAPVCHVSYYEADAFARWAGARLPSEAEWECAASEAAVEGHFVESGRLHPAPRGGGGPGPAQLFGDVWEWTRSPYAPYPQFRPLAGSLGEYNAKFMSSQMVLRGGSCATPRSHVRSSYRNFFYPDARWQWSGIRLARDAG